MPESASFRLAERVGRADRVEVPDDVVARVRALHEAGRYLDAFEASRAAGPLQAWSGPRALVAGARLARNLGARRLADLLITRAGREHPGHPAVAGDWCNHLIDRRGPIVAWRAALAAEARIDDAWSPEEVADLLMVRAQVAATYRDVSTSAALLARARSTAPDDPWPVVGSAHVAELEDRREDALLHAREALERRPGYRPAIQAIVHLLHLLGRREEAVAFLEATVRDLQSPLVGMQWFDLVRDTGEPAHLLALLDRVEALCPIPWRPVADWLAAARCRVHERAGNLAAAAAEADRLGTPWYVALAERLRRPDPAWRRVRLPVPHVAQDHRTCGPATLSAISAHLGRPVPQPTIVAAICYAGTYADAERTWCEDNGFAAREFSVGWDTARRLVDASLPFALETKAVDGGHLQTVAGYDEMRGALLLEDPGSSDLVEVEAVPFLESQRLTGPRGLVFVPAAERERLASLDLPETDLHDRRFAAEAALTRWDRDRAAAELAALEAQAPGHPITWMTRLALAGFDGDQIERHRAIDALLAHFPKDGRILRWKLGCLREAGRREERIELLRGALEAGVEGYAFRRELASELMQDARTRPLARRLLRLAHRNAPRDTRTLRLLADLESRDGDDERSLDVRRFAAACEDTDEDLARAWFDAAVVAGRADEALEWLQRRFRVLGARSSAPAVTLSQVLERLARTEEALSVLCEAVERRPDDGSLRLHLATAHARRGDRAAAREHLEAARATTRPGEWRRTEASLLERDGDLAGAEAAWRQVLEREPLALDAHREVAWHLGSREGRSGAVAYLEEVCARYPHHDGLATHLLSWVREQDPERAEALTRRHIDAEPSDAWWRRERALLLRRLGRLEEAIVEASAAREIAPRAPASHGIAASLEAEAGRTERAREGYREAIGLDVDYGWAVDRLLELAGTDDRRREELAFVRAELVRQTSTGDGLTAWVEGARRLFEPEALRADLVALRDLRPDLCEAWTELARQTLDAGMEAEAEQVAAEATRRFPLRHETWQALATVRRRRGDVTRATEAVRKAVEIGPDQPDAWFSLASHLTDAGETEAAEKTLREGVRRHPFDPALALRLARARWEAGDEKEGWTIAARIVTTRPSAQRAWDCLDGWATTAALRADLVGLARAWTSARPGEAQAWTRLADVLPPSDFAERTAALERAIALNPRDPIAYDLLATVLADAERYEEARAVVKRGPWPDAERPVTLEGRDAWVLARQGRQADAIARMSGVVERSAGYWWGWSRLAEWAEKADDTVAWERASKALLRLAPADADAHLVAADLAARMDRGAEAREHFQRVLALEPGHLYAARRLLDLARQAGDLDALEVLAERLPTEGAAGGTAAAARTLAAALRGDPATCWNELAPLVRSGDVSPAVAEIVDAALSDEFDGRMQRGYARALDRAVESDEVGPAFARAWMLRRVRAGRWSAVRRFDAWLPRLGASVEPALGEVLDEAGEQQAARKVVPRLLRRHRDRLRADPTLWGKVGYALVSSGRDVDAARWLAGGETRDDAEPWMLWNYNLSLRRLGLHRETEAVSLAVVSRGMRDDRWGDHVGHAAYGEALAGRYASARSILAQDAPTSNVAEVPARRRLLYELASSLCAVGEAAATGDGATRLRPALGRLRVLAEETTDAGDDDRARYAEGLRAMGAAAGVRVPFWRRRWPGPKPVSERGGWKRNLWYMFLGLLVVRLLLRHWR